MKRLEATKILGECECVISYELDDKEVTITRVTHKEHLVTSLIHKMTLEEWEGQLEEYHHEYQK